MPLAVGSQLGQYVVRSLLGVGGMGEVYLAYDVKLERTTALKVLPSETTKPQSLRRFIKEARAASSLNHPNVAHIYDIEEFDSLHFIALEYIAGKTLRVRLREGQMEAAEIVEVALRVSSALVAAHAAGIIHRDIKPENIMITPEGYIKVLDFGLAKLPELHSDKSLNGNSTLSFALSEPGLMMGTVSYMSPEQTRGINVDARTDIWSLGVVLYEMITGKQPFAGATTSDVIAAILKQDLEPIEESADRIPQELISIVEKALQKNPAERFEKVSQLHQALKALKASLISQASFDSTPSPDGVSARTKIWGSSKSNSAASTPVVVSAVKPGFRFPSRNRLILFALLLIAAVTVSVIVYWWLTRPSITNSAVTSRPFKRITFDSGLQSNPTWSPDGRLIAYSSNASGNFDIWAQSLAGGGAPLRLTDSPAHDWQPDWSPDGNLIVFRSEREGGGLYVVPAFYGGQARRISSFGYNPRWSPDGSRILFFNLGNRLYERPRVYLVGLDGSQPVEILSSYNGIYRGALDWFPDGKRVSFWGDDKVLWTVPIDGGAPVKSELDSKVAREINESALDLESFRWGPTADSLFIEARSEGILNLWKITVDPRTLKWIAGPERLTSSEGQDTEISLSRDGKKLAFTKKNQSTGIWLLPFDPFAGRVTNDGRMVTPKDLDAWFPDINADGSKMVFSVFKQGMTKHELWVTSLSDLNSKKVSDVEGAWPYCLRWSPDSSEIVFSRIGPINTVTSKRFGSIVALNLTTSSERPMTLPPEAGEQPFRDYIYEWTPDGKWLLVSTDRLTKRRWLIAVYSTAAAPHAEKDMRVLVKDPEADLWAPRLSPNGKWVCFLSQKEKDQSSSVLNIVPFGGGTPIAITDQRSWADKPRWSPDGKTIFFISNQNSYFLNVWGIRFDPEQGKPMGEPFQVTTIGSPGQMIADRLSFMEMSFNQKSLALPITQVTGNIWMVENP